MRRIFTCLPLIVLVISGITAHAAPIGHVSGTVYDVTTRSPLVGANIIIRDTDAGGATDEQGRFLITNIPAGTYLIEASMVGYRSQVKTSVTVQAGRSTELLFSLTQALIEVGAVTVRANFFPKVKDAPVSERNFTAEEIEVQPGGMGDISRVVQTMPAVVSTGDQDNEIIVRGGSPNENLFLVDGVELPYPNHINQRGEQGGGINILNSLVIREIDFIAGAFPARYGDRSSSVMNIALRNGQKEKLGANIDMGLAGLGMVFEGPLPGNGTFIGAYHKSLLEIMDKMGILGMDIVPEYTNYLGKISYDITPADKIYLLSIYAHDRAVAQPGEGIFDEDYAYDFQTSRLALGIGWQRLFGNIGFGTFLVSGSRIQWHDYAQEVDDDILGDTLNRTYADEQVWGAQYTAALRWSSFHETEVGASAKATPFSHDVYVRAETVYTYTYDQDSMVIDSTPYLDENGEPVVQGPVNMDVACRSYKLAAYIQHQITIARFGHLTLGVRGDYFEFNDDVSVSPRLGLSTEPLFYGFSFIAGFGWHYQSPPYNILLYDTTAHRLLENRRSDHYIIGVERLIADDAKLTVEAFEKRDHHLYIPEYWTTDDPYDRGVTYVDRGTGYARGVEIFFQKKFAHDWHATLSYSFSRACMTDPRDPATTVPALYDYGHVFTVLGAYRIDHRDHAWYTAMPKWLKYSVGILLFPDISDIGLRFRFMGGRPYTPMIWQPETRQWIEPDDLLYSERLPDYHRFDIRWDHTYLFRTWSLSWYIEIQNVYDRKNVWWYTYEADGTIDEVDQFRLFPVGGLVVEF